jgi:hypothetical protein
MKRIDPHHGLNGECQGAPSRHPMFRGSIPRLNMGGASPRGAFPRSALASERLVSERSGSSEQPLSPSLFLLKISLFPVSLCFFKQFPTRKNPHANFVKPARRGPKRSF